ncbi:MAG: hypothetical protein ACR2RL_24895 [Gammaproteobacteria bacterium]
MIRKLQALVAAAFLLSWMGGAQAGMVVLGADVANGIGDQGNTGQPDSPFLFPFSSDAPKFEGALVELANYDALAIAVTDENGFALVPQIEFNPGKTILFSFMGTTGNYTAHVAGVGPGAFGLEIRAVPIPAAMILFGSAIALFGVMGRSKKIRSAAA